MGTKTAKPVLEQVWYVGCQNDLVYIICGRAPSMNNDYPVHDADRTVVTRVNCLDDPNATTEIAIAEHIVALHNATL